MVEERHEVGIIAVVIDDETGIDRHGANRGGHGHGVGMPAEAVGFFIEDDVHALAEQPRGRQAGYAGSDDRNAPLLPFFSAPDIHSRTSHV